jgi:hypothetical protein
MKISRSFALLLFTAALLGLGGCSTLNPKEMLAHFESGEHPLYGVVAGKPRKIHELTDYVDFKKTCGRQTIFGDSIEPSFNEWLAKNVCGNMDKWQLVPLVYHTKVWGMKGLKSIRAYAPVEWNIEEDDILELSMHISNEGRVLRTHTVKRIARKAKDATKESGCWWDGGKGATTAFISGGAVCDGWNWKNQKFANE